MSWKDTLFSNMFIRNMLADFGSRSANASDKSTVIPYFQYKIGKYQPDHYLYFPKQPSARQYKNEIFNKLQEYEGYDLIRYLEFHFSAYEDKQEFLRFLHFEVEERLKRKPSASRTVKYKVVADWVVTQLNELLAHQREHIREGIKDQVQVVLAEGGHPNGSLPAEVLNSLSEKLTAHLESWVGAAEEKLSLIAGSLPAANIHLYSELHEQRLVQLFCLLQTVKVGKAEPLFKKFTGNDLAVILNLHFSSFTGKKINTVEKYVRECRDMVPRNEKAQALEAALEKFFS